MILVGTMEVTYCFLVCVVCLCYDWELVDVSGTPVARKVIRIFLDGGELGWETHDIAMAEVVVCFVDSVEEELLLMGEASGEEVLECFRWLISK